MGRRLTLLAVAVASTAALSAEAAESRSRVKLLAPPPKVESRAPVEAPRASSTQAQVPIREVTVYSDRARVVRAAELPLAAGPQRIAFPTLPATIDPASVRVTVRDATLRRIEVRRLERGELPRPEAEKLIRDYEVASDQLSALTGERVVLEQERALLAGLRPASAPNRSANGATELLEPGGWRAGSAFVETRTAQVDGALGSLDTQIASQRKVLARLAAEAQQLAAGVTGQPGYEVTAFVDGRGAPAEFELTYVARNARWYPAYDVHHTAGSGQVELAFAGLVSQQTGEDWVDARLVLSTAVPATTCELPKLAAWKIGERNQFIPIPRAKPEPPVSPPAPAPRRVRGSSDEDQRLRIAIASIAQTPVPLAPAPVESQGEGYAFADDLAAGEMAVGDMEEAPEADAPATGSLSFAPKTPSAAPPPSRRQSQAKMSSSSFEAIASAGRSEPMDSVAFGAPRGWHMPSLAPDLPASLAGGYDFTYSAARAETVRTGGDVRRISLHSAAFPAELVVTVLPGVSTQAYLVAEVTNRSDRPLLRGRANLFVGADLQGQALIETTAVGEKVKLPLGIDEAFQIERNVKVVTEETGLLSKKDVTHYRVTIELLNPHRAPAQVRVVDQVPLARGKDLEVALASTTPGARHDKAEGKLEWELELKPSEKRVLSFEYVLTRPRGAKLNQW